LIFQNVEKTKTFLLFSRKNIFSVLDFECVLNSMFHLFKYFKNVSDIDDYFLTKILIRVCTNLVGFLQECF